MRLSGTNARSSDTGHRWKRKNRLTSRDPRHLFATRRKHSIYYTSSGARDSQSTPSPRIASQDMIYLLYSHVVVSCLTLINRLSHPYSYRCQLTHHFDSFRCRARPPKYISKMIIAFIWIISILFSIPMAVALRVIQMPFRKYPRDRCSEWRSFEDFFMFYYLFFFYRKWWLERNISILWCCQFDR